MRVLLGDLVAGIHHQHHHIGILDGLHGLDHGKFFHRFVHLAAPPHPGGIDDGVLLAVALKVDVDTVARGARLVERDHALFAEYGVHQGGFADIRAADDGQFGGVFVVGFFLIYLKWKIFQRDLDYFAHVVAVRR
jgi:hypothetical protein